MVILKRTKIIKIYDVLMWRCADVLMKSEGLKCE
jgi:hypothetical protein